MAKSFTVEVRITISDDADPHEVAQEMDYGFTHDAIVDTEIRDVTVPDDQ